MSTSTNIGLKKKFLFWKKDFSFLDRRKAGDNSGNDFNVPEYLLPNQKDVLLTPLFSANNKVKVNIQCGMNDENLLRF